MPFIFLFSVTIYSAKVLYYMKDGFLRNKNVSGELQHKKLKIKLYKEEQKYEQ